MKSQLLDKTSDYTIAEASSILNCTNPTTYSLIAKGQLDSYKVGRARRVTHESVQRLRSGGVR